jgi:4-carboxymuconolactone decarboxylase
MGARTMLAAVVGGLVGAVGAVVAQRSPVLNLAGDRFKPLTYEQLTPEQKTLVDHILSGPRASLGGPFNVLLRSPELGDLAQQLGAYVRFRSSLPRRLNEMAILMVARAWTAQYEWYVHKRAALQAGLSPAIVEAIAAGRRPESMPPEEAAVYDFCRELMESKEVSDPTFAAAVAAFGERGVVDLIGVAGYYHLVSMLLNVDRYPLPPGARPELKPLK